MYPNGEAWAAPDALLESNALAAAGRNSDGSASGPGGATGLGAGAGAGAQRAKGGWSQAASSSAAADGDEDAPPTPMSVTWRSYDVISAMADHLETVGELVGLVSHLLATAAALPVVAAAATNSSADAHRLAIGAGGVRVNPATYTLYTLPAHTSLYPDPFVGPSQHV